MPTQAVVQTPLRSPTVSVNWLNMSDPSTAAVLVNKFNFPGKVRMSTKVAISSFLHATAVTAFGHSSFRISGLICVNVSWIAFNLPTKSVRTHHIEIRDLISRQIFSRLVFNSNFNGDVMGCSILVAPCVSRYRVIVRNFLVAFIS
jgi:hypothetical protein